MRKMRRDFESLHKGLRREYLTEPEMALLDSLERNWAENEDEVLPESENEVNVKIVGGVKICTKKNPTKK